MKDNVHFVLLGITTMALFVPPSSRYVSIQRRKRRAQIVHKWMSRPYSSRFASTIQQDCFDASLPPGLGDTCPGGASGTVNCVFPMECHPTFLRCVCFYGYVANAHGQCQQVSRGSLPKATKSRILGILSFSYGRIYGLDFWSHRCHIARKWLLHYVGK